MTSFSYYDFFFVFKHNLFYSFLLHRHNCYPRQNKYPIKTIENPKTFYCIKKYAILFETERESMQNH